MVRNFFLILFNHEYHENSIWANTKHFTEDHQHKKVFKTSRLEKKNIFKNFLIISSMLSLYVAGATNAVLSW